MTEAKQLAARLSEAQRHILCHSLGLDDRGRGKSYRNHFVTGEGSVDHPHCMALVELGCMIRRDGSAISGGDDVFFVTPLGRAAVLAVRTELEKAPNHAE